MKCIVLGCGSSLGTPEIGCKCVTCTSDNPKNARSRSSIYLESPKAKVFIDSSTDLRQQALSNNLTSMDAIVFTHAHADHISGLDDLKAIIKNSNPPINAYMNEQTWGWIKGTYAYLFQHTGSALYSPILDCQIIPNEQEIIINDMSLLTFPQLHGEIITLGIRVSNLVYSTDFNQIPESSFKYLKDIDYWIIDCMRYSWSPSHSTYERTLDLIDRVKPKQAILTHMSHEIEYESFKKILPANVVPAYDGMVIEFK